METCWSVAIPNPKPSIMKLLSKAAANAIVDRPFEIRHALDFAMIT
jgi:hypothetical protein